MVTEGLLAKHPMVPPGLKRHIANNRTLDICRSSMRRHCRVPEISVFVRLDAATCSVVTTVPGGKSVSLQLVFADQLLSEKLVVLNILKEQR